MNGVGASTAFWDVDTPSVKKDKPPPLILGVVIQWYLDGFFGYVGVEANVLSVSSTTPQFDLVPFFRRKCLSDPLEDCISPVTTTLMIALLFVLLGIMNQAFQFVQSHINLEIVVVAVLVAFRPPGSLASLQRRCLFIEESPQLCAHSLAQEQPMFGCYECSLWCRIGSLDDVHAVVTVVLEALSLFILVIEKKVGVGEEIPT
mmetsp:Transcript_34885/g.48702  ORF Transcript_34885/g.48702 Transcript_34885/m.48702 type:complete len:203 (-) Transcript_34885:270-878(-)